MPERAYRGLYPVYRFSRGLVTGWNYIRSYPLYHLRHGTQPITVLVNPLVVHSKPGTLPTVARGWGCLILKPEARDPKKALQASGGLLGV